MDLNATLEGIAKLDFAVIGGHVESAEALIEGGADVDAPDDEGRVPIFLSVAYNNLEMTGLLLTYDADPNKETCRDYYSALQRAVAIFLILVIHLTVFHCYWMGQCSNLLHEVVS